MSDSLKPRLSKIGLGCVTFGREIDEAASFVMMDYALKHNITFFDTASAYAAGGSEKVVGAWLASRKPKPGAVVLATKITKPYIPEQIEERVNQSLARLGVDSVDLFYLHSWDEEAANPGVLAALDRIVRSGKAKTIGVSNFNAEQLERVLKLQKANGWARMKAVQNTHTFAVRHVDDPLVALCAREDVAIVTYSPLGAGFLTGKHQGGVAPGSRFDIIPGHQPIYFNDSARTRLAQLEGVAAKSGRSLVQLALSWVLHKPWVGSVLVGGRTTAHLDQAIAALAFDPTEAFRGVPDA